MATTSIIGAGEARTVVLPMITLGGTSAKRLYEMFSNVLDSLRQTRDYMTDWPTPAARDYHQLPANEAACALNQHGERLNAIDRLIADYEALQSHAADAVR